MVIKSNMQPPSIRPIVLPYVQQRRSLETLPDDPRLKSLFETAYDFMQHKFGRVGVKELGLAAVMVELTLLVGAGDLVHWLPKADDGALSKPQFVKALQNVVSANMQTGMLRMVRALQDEHRMTSSTDRAVWEGLVPEWPGVDDGHDTLLAKPARRSATLFGANDKIRLR